MNPLKNQSRPSIKNTFCVFKELLLNKVPNLAPDFVSAAGSQYFYEEHGLFRLSNHWGRAGNSKWRLTPLPEYNDLPNRRLKLGFSKWDDFYEDNNFEKLYFIELDFKNKEVHFNHKNNIEPQQKVVLRTSLETSKMIKKIRGYFKSNSKFKYFENDAAIELYLDNLINETT